MWLEAIGHGVSEQMRAVNFLDSLSEVSALSAVLLALRVLDNLSCTKACSAARTNLVMVVMSTVTVVC
jgi:hypothetical protein